jgi:MFS family permease
MSAIPATPAGRSSPSFATTVACLALAQLLCWAALYYTFSAFVLPMRDSLGWSKPALMGAFTLGLAVWGAASYGAGAAIDRGHGRRVMAGGAALAGLGFLLWASVQSLPMLYLAWVLLGVAMAMTLYEPAFSVVTRRFPTRFGSAITWLTLVGGFASTLSFPVTLWLIGAFGWRVALVAIGLVLLLVAAPLNAWALQGPDAPPRERHTDAADDATLHEALRHRAFWLLAATFMLYSVVSATFWAHVMPAFASKGTPEADALTVLMWIGPAQVLGRLAFLGAGRRLTPRVLGLAVFAAMPLSLLLFALAGSLWALLVFAVMFGAANGLVTIVRGHVVPTYFGHAHVGRISGLLSVLALVPRAVGPLAGAWVLLVVPGYRELLLLLALVALLAWAAFVLAGRPLRAG